MDDNMKISTYALFKKATTICQILQEDYLDIDDEKRILKMVEQLLLFRDNYDSESGISSAKYVAK